VNDLIRTQLAQSVATMQSALDDAPLQATLLAASTLTADALRAGHTLFVAGNGGSAADAQHLVAEFVVRLTVTRPPLRAVALTTDSSILTATANDFGYEQVFARQLEALGRAGDVFLAISTSGNSANLLSALQTAKRQGLHTIALTGNDGGAMRPISDLNLIVRSETTAKIQECHLALEHIFCMLVERHLFGIDFDQAPQPIAE
jgi:D-sedoheptulose 7-phosphate isomerase